MLRNLACISLTTVVAMSALGAAPSPDIHREDIEWCNVWIVDGAGTKLPRVLLIGDSITQGYYDGVASRLKGKASVCRLTTSKSLGDPVLLDEVALVAKQHKFDVIHFNNGLHGAAYTEDEYKRDLPKLVRTLRKHAPDAKLIWASSTPMRVGSDLSQINPYTERVKARNRIAAEYMATQRIPVDDLFSLVLDHPEYYAVDGVHFNQKGVDAQAEQVAGFVGNALPTGE